MSKALEAAVKAGRERGYEGCYDDGLLIQPFDADDARAIITAFLDAAAGDEDVSGDVGYAVARANAETFEGNGKAAILALKGEVG